MRIRLGEAGSILGGAERGGTDPVRGHKGRYRVPPVVMTHPCARPILETAHACTLGISCDWR